LITIFPRFHHRPVHTHHEHCSFLSKSRQGLSTICECSLSRVLCYPIVDAASWPGYYDARFPDSPGKFIQAGRPSDLLTLLPSCVHGADYQIDDSFGVSWRRQTAIYHGPPSTTPWPNLDLPCFCPNLGMRAAALVLYCESCFSCSTLRKDTMPLLRAILYINCQRMQTSANVC
jgi:hypothetical protein